MRITTILGVVLLALALLACVGCTSGAAAFPTAEQAEKRGHDIYFNFSPVLAEGGKVAGASGGTISDSGATIAGGEETRGSNTTNAETGDTDGDATTDADASGLPGS